MNLYIFYSHVTERESDTLEKLKRGAYSRRPPLVTDKFVQKLMVQAVNAESSERKDFME